MTDDAKLTKDVNDLYSKIEEKLGTKDRPVSELPRDAKVLLCRRFFGEFASLRNTAEAAGAAKTMELLDSRRGELKIAKKGQTAVNKVSMYVRLSLTAFMAMWGALCLLAALPLRLCHPFLRSLGVRNGRMPLDILVGQWARGVLAAAGVQVEIDGHADWVSQLDLVGIIVYNHGSNLDPFIIQTVCQSSPKYIGKKVLFMLPVVGWLFMLMGMVPINRGDREKALKTMNEAVAGIMKKWRRSVAIAPEGTRTTDGHLRLPFKKGVFHLQDQTKVPLLPVVIYGASELWPPGRVFASAGKVTVSFLPAQKAQEGRSHDESRLELQRGYSELIAKHPDRGARSLSPTDIAGCICRLILTGGAYWTTWRLLLSIAASIGLGTRGWIGVFFAASITAALYVEKFL